MDALFNASLFNSRDFYRPNICRKNERTEIFRWYCSIYVYTRDFRGVIRIYGCYSNSHYYPWYGMWSRLRSEEHTSELQSRGQLVCRLLLDKKNKCYL